MDISIIRDVVREESPECRQRFFRYGEEEFKGITAAQEKLLETLLLERLVEFTSIEQGSFKAAEDLEYEYHRWKKDNPKLWELDYSVLVKDSEFQATYALALRDKAELIKAIDKVLGKPTDVVSREAAHDALVVVTGVEWEGSKSASGYIWTTKEPVIDTISDKPNHSEYTLVKLLKEVLGDNTPPIDYEQWLVPPTNTSQVLVDPLGRVWLYHYGITTEGLKELEAADLYDEFHQDLPDAVIKMAEKVLGPEYVKGRNGR